MAPSLSSYLSLASLYTFYLRRCFSAAGLSEKTTATDPTTTVQFWSPTKPNPQNPSLLLLHGFGPVAIWQWRRQVQHFATRYNVYVPNLVFFGDSHTTSSRRSEVFQAEAVAALMDKLRVGGKYSVVGTSYGGFVAYHVARMFPDRVEKVVVASSGINMRPADNDELVRKAKVESIGDLMLPQTASHLRALLGVAASASVRRAPDFLLNDLINKLYAEKRNEKLELLQGLTLGQDDTLTLSPLQQEVLLIWGEDDQIFPLKMAHELKGLIGKKNNVKLEVMKKASHVPQIEDAPQFNKILHAFLSS
ncbi:unnamed protein product [Linum trigynum]|uniref:AB hydrolase-1 domain-containing protein n=1 Tax=Linum trigynum TaxID=586398 RepID=A0AAV2EWD7_9ROSI